MTDNNSITTQYSLIFSVLTTSPANHPALDISEPKHELCRTDFPLRSLLGRYTQNIDTETEMSQCSRKCHNSKYYK